MRRLLQVEVLRDGELFLAQTLRPGRPLRLGPTPDCEIPTEVLDAPLALVVPGPEGYGVRLREPLSGRLRVAGRTLRIEGGLLVDPRPEPLTLVDGDGGEVVLDEHLRLRFRVLRAESAFGWSPRPELRLGLSLATVAALVVAGAVVVHRHAPPPTPKGREVRLTVRPARLARLPRPALAKKLDGKGPTPRKPAARRTSRPRTAQVALQRGVLGALDRRVGQLVSPGKRGRDPLAALNKLLTVSTTGIPTPRSGGAGRGSDRLGSWLATPGLGDAASLTAALPVPKASARLPRLALPEAGKVGSPAAPAASGPSREEVREVVSRGGAGIRVCYERELIGSASPREGRVLLRWTIDAKGHVTNLVVEKDTIRIPELRECLLRQVRSWTFPPCSEGCTIVYPFEFFTRS